MQVKTTIDQKCLSQALGVLASVIPSKNPLPLLQTVMVSRVDDKFYLTGCDGDSRLVLECVDQEGQPYVHVVDDDKNDPFMAVCINFRDLKEAIGVLPAGRLLEVEMDSAQGLMQVDYQIGKFKMPIESADEYPAPRQVVTKEMAAQGQGTAVCQFVMAANELLPVVRQAKICASTNDLRPVMCAEALDVSHGGLTIAASDGHSMYRRVMDRGAGWLKYGEFKADESVILIVPRLVLPTICAAFAGMGDITITADTQMIEWRAGNSTLTVRMVEGNYPKYNSVIPANLGDHKVTVCTADLTGALRRLQLFANSDSNMCIISREGDTLVVAAEDDAYSKSGSEQVAIVNAGETTLKEGEYYGFKISTLAGLLGTIDDENTQLYMTAPEKPVVLKPEDAKKQSLTLLQMPMLVDYTK